MADIDHKRDELLAVRCRLGEPAAFDELIDRWHAPLWTYARAMAGTDDQAWDVVQDVWLRVIRGIPRLRDSAKLRQWLFGITRRVLMDRLRDKYKTVKHADLDAQNIAAESADDEIERELAHLDRLIERLPVLEREVLTLFYLKELSLNEVAAATDVPAGTVKSRLFRARRMLRHQIEGKP
jgi:RNA polymerase sigma-70 factor (ECF subfamily)